MPSETVERRPSRQFNNHLHHPTTNHPPVAENLPCPRCESTTTKFCYYNNYNMSQPRYFCKSCRRYWTQGGTLRNIPVGGGTRKHSKRSRISSNSSPSSSCSSITHDPKLQPMPASLFKPDLNTFLSNGGVNDGGVVSNGFSALLNAHGPGFLALSGGGGYGTTPVGTGFDEMGYGLTRNVGFWSFPEVGADSSSVASSRRNTCPVSGNVDGGWPDVDCFGWPDLAISMPGNGLK